ncbi:hypothetical protein [Paenibacillus puerhi]|uniref:hypothetical protein n=1 Tax=Paenibacillus puerhi TaxID=2692622 RepID=UPI00135AAC7F|nr:hypothetical protein [Paenibacillus puerhi]
MKQEYENLEIYEGTEQPNLFVEIWSGLSDEAYGELKAARIGEYEAAGSEQSPGGWRTMERWVVGGRAKIHMWQFKTI